MEENRAPAAPASPPARKSGLTELFGVALMILGALVFLALASHQSQINAGERAVADANLIGAFGHYASELLFFLFGKSSFLLGPYLFLLGFLTLYRGGFSDPLSRTVAVLTVMTGTSLLAALLFQVDGQPSLAAGGAMGAYIGGALRTLFGQSGAIIVSFGALISGVFLAIRIPMPIFLRRLRDRVEDIARHYSQTFSAANYRPEALASAPGARPRAFESAVAESRPWIERRETVPPEAPAPAEVPAPPAPVLDAQEERVPEPAPPLRSSVPLPRRNLDSLLGRLESRRSAEPEPVAARASEPDKFQGWFNEDESRFHFRTAPPARRARAFAARGVSSALERDATRPLMRPLDLSLIEPLAAPTPELYRDRADLARGPAPTRSISENPRAAIDSAEHVADADADLDQAYFDEAELDPEESAGFESPYNDADDADDEADDLDEPVEADESEDFADTDLEDAGLDPEETVQIDEELKAAPMPAPRPERREAIAVSQVPPFRLRTKQYRLATGVLAASQRPPQADVSREIDLTKARLEKVMQDYGIQAKVVDIQRGPIITLYEIKLEPGVRVARILGIQDEIKMNLESPSVRIIAPIPGKPTVGIEIPNRNREPVLLGDMLKSDLEQLAQRKELSVVAGKNIAGEKQYIDLTKLPHLLIAGATGAGKSVYMNAIIASLLYTKSPEDVRFIMIDPKMVELKLYDGIPHLLLPVITDVRKASRALYWLVGEMERRYSILSRLKCRDIRSYNERVAGQAALPGLADAQPAEPRMPYIVMFIDELSDLMMVSAKDVEDSIIRLTQKARAVGIHLIMATQRPSVDVITALIKANCPARIAFQVAQRTDSRTILDMNGAETLLGKGDMLYKSPTATNLVRIQAPLITEEEIEAIVRDARRFGEPVYVEIEDFDESGGGEDDGEVDPELFAQAWKVIQESGKTSTSYVQRRLRIGYNRAANIIEQLEERGYLSPALGNKPREILKRS